MRPHSETEENYLKALFHLTKEGEAASTNALAQQLSTSAASVTDMIKRMNEKALVDYTPYKGATLTAAGREIAVSIIRRHRLWEVFLVQKLGFPWDGVHEVAEQLEHVESDTLIRKLDQYLGFPQFDPHGDPIPDESGAFTERPVRPLGKLNAGEKAIIARVATDEASFLQYLDKTGLTIGQAVQVVEHLPYDDSLHLQTDTGKVMISGNVAKNIFVLG